MNVQLISDLHIEINKKCIEINPMCNILVIAGDLISYDYMSVLDRFFNYVCPLFKYVIYVLGNHEFHKQLNIPMEEVINKYKNKCKEYNVILLNNSSVEINGYLFIGSTLWCNIPENKYNTSFIKYYFEKCVDIHGINITTCNDLHKQSVDYLDKIINTNPNKKLIIISHFVPTINENTQNPLYKNRKDSEYGFHTELNYLFKPNVKAWLFGHNHYSSYSKINNMILASNAFGYIKANDKKEETNFESNLVINIKSAML
jgi:hypothetical protein